MQAAPAGIASWQRIDADTTTSGWLSAAQIQPLAQLGIRHVINLAMGNQPGALANEADLLAEQGIAYTHIPVPFDGPEERHFATFCDAYETGPRPVHIHCIMNLRVSAFLYRYHCERRGMDEASARALMEQQWAPEASEHPDATTWARFISARGI